MKLEFVARPCFGIALFILAGIASADCPSPSQHQQLCSYYHPGSVATSYCMNEMCFEMSYGEEMRVIAADDRGDYPLTWFVWSVGNLDSSPYPLPCNLAKEGKKKTRVEITPDDPRCATDIWTATTLYHEHFLSSPETQCLGWLECKEGVIYTPPSLNPPEGPIGTAITISDPQKSIEQGDIARFYPPGGDPTTGTAAVDTWISPDGGSLAALVPPNIPPDMQYSVAVVSPEGVVRFEQLGFYVRLS